MKTKMKGLLVKAAWWLVRRLGLHLSCPTHPTYHGLRQRPRGDAKGLLPACSVCELIYKAVR